MGTGQGLVTPVTLNAGRRHIAARLIAQQSLSRKGKRGAAMVYEDYLLLVLLIIALFLAKWEAGHWKH